MFRTTILETASNEREYRLLAVCVSKPDRSNTHMRVHQIQYAGYGKGVVAGFPSFRCVFVASRANNFFGTPIACVIDLVCICLSILAGFGGAAAPGEDGRADLGPAD